MNVYSLYVTLTRFERNYFNSVIEFIKTKNVSNLVIIHLNFAFKSVINNLKLNTKPLVCGIYLFSGDTFSFTQKSFTTFDDLVSVFPKFSGNTNAFIYSGHSNGMFMMKRRIRILRVDDFCELTYRVVGKKLDVLGYDCCLCGNINCLTTSYNYANYVIASSGYWAEISMLRTNAFYNFVGNIALFSKNVVAELINRETQSKENYITNYSVYELNNSLLELAKLTLKYKDQFITKKNVIIESYYYKDLECCFKDLNIDIKPLIDKFVLFTRFPTNKCYNTRKSKKANKSYPSSLSIITKRPVKGGLPAFGDIFLKRNNL